MFNQKVNYFRQLASAFPQLCCLKFSFKLVDIYTTYAINGDDRCVLIF